MPYSKTKTHKARKVGHGSRIIAARVTDIILDIEHEKAGDFGGYDAVGTIGFMPLYDRHPIQNEWKYRAKPIFANIKNYPLVNEVVLIITSEDKSLYGEKGGSNYYLSTLNIWNHPHHNALPSMKTFDAEGSPQPEDYEEAEGGMVRRVTDNATDIPLGYYFEEQINLKPLLPYEGDMIIEGRFGNFIRFGSTALETKTKNGITRQSLPEENKNRWSNEGQTGEPIIIIRNGQNPLEKPEGWKHTVEDIDLDASSIYLTSNQQLTDFIPSSTNNKSYYAK